MEADKMIDIIRLFNKAGYEVEQVKYDAGAIAFSVVPKTAPKKELKKV